MSDRDKERLTTPLKGGRDAFGMPLASSYDLDLGTAQGRIKARCKLGRYEDTGLTPAEITALKSRLEEAEDDRNGCGGCEHRGAYENEVEYGYPSPCTGCRRRAIDRYEKRGLKEDKT